MKKILTSMYLILLMSVLMNNVFAQIGIGIAAPHPTAMLHVETGSSLTNGILFTGKYNVLSSVPNLDSGTRLMFYPGKDAFRAGTVTGSEWNNINVGNHSVALGYNTQARGEFSFAAGNKALAQGYKSLSIGDATSAGGINSVAFGSGTSAGGAYATSTGISTKAIGSVSTAMGAYSEASGMTSTAMGNRTSASGDFSTATGQYTQSDSYGSFTMGQYNNSFTGIDPLHWITTDPLLILGNGISLTARSNALVVYKNGNTDINGFTRLGKASEGTPAIKMKKITGTGPEVNGNVTVPHSLNAAKILSVQIFMQYGASPAATKTLPPSYTLIAGYEYQYEIDGANILITNKSGNSTNIGNKAFKMLITYEE